MTARVADEFDEQRSSHGPSYPSAPRPRQRRRSSANQR